MKISLDGRRAFVSGGGEGIGRATVTALLEAGAQVATCDIDPATLTSLPSEAETFECDVSDSAQVDQVFAHIDKEGLDILVNNAGIAGPTAPVEDITDEGWRQTMAVGIDSQFYCARRAVPIFKRQGSGVIVNIVSTAGLFGFPNRSPYAAAKWAVTGFTKTLAMELGPHNIRVNGIAPGSVNGDRMERVIASHAETEGISEEAVRNLYTVGVSMQCFIDPEEIAATICFLASDLGRHISGQIIGVDGHTETLHPRL